MPAVLRSSFRVVVRRLLLTAGFMMSAVSCVWPQAKEDSGESSTVGSTARTIFRWNSQEEPVGGPSDWDEPLASDRPDFTEASSTVGQGKRQLEMGYTYFSDEGSNLTSHSYPEVLFRQGVIADWLELRVGWTFASESEVVNLVSSTAHGSEDLYLGLKLGLTAQQGILPEMALAPQMTVPLGSEFSSNRVLPGLNWLYGWELSERFSMGGSSQFNMSLDEFTDELHGEFAQSWTVGASLTERLSGYKEWFVFVPTGADTEHTEHYFDGGFTFRWSNNLQSDLRVGKGVSRSSTDHFIGTGFVVRF